MHAFRSRRTVLKVLAGAGVAVAATRAVPAATQQVGVDSGGIGLLRPDFEAAYGTGTPWEQLVEYSNVTVGVPGATMYARYRGEVVDHLEVRWSDATQTEGIDWSTAYQAALGLLPVDAQYRDQYWMPATPEGPVEIIGHTYESAQLNAAHVNLGRVLVLFQRDLTRQTPNSLAEPVVPAVTLTMASVPQQAERCPCRSRLESEPGALGHHALATPIFAGVVVATSTCTLSFISSRAVSRDAMIACSTAGEMSPVSHTESGRKASTSARARASSWAAWRSVANEVVPGSRMRSIMVRSGYAPGPAATVRSVTVCSAGRRGGWIA